MDCADVQLSSKLTTSLKRITDTVILPPQVGGDITKLMQKILESRTPFLFKYIDQITTNKKIDFSDKMWLSR